MTILLVEDNEPLRTAMKKVLTVSGFTVLEATNGKEALKVVSAHSGVIDLLITDVTMPEMGGKELGNLLLAKQPGLKVIYISGYPLENSQEEQPPKDQRITLQKPISMSMLVKTIRDMLKE